MKPKLKRAIRRGDFVELIQDVNAIPRGVYLVEASLGDSVLCQVAEGLLFGISGYVPELLRRVDAHEGLLRRTSVDQFAARYSRLSAGLQRAVQEQRPDRPVTGLFADPTADLPQDIFTPWTLELDTH